MMKNHINEGEGRTPVFTARILAVEKNAGKRKARKAIEIRDLKPAINSNSGWKID